MKGHELLAAADDLRARAEAYRESLRGKSPVELQEVLRQARIKWKSERRDDLVQAAVDGFIDGKIERQ